MVSVVSSPSMVGRDRELAAMVAAVESSGDGPVTILVRGEAGIGKTRLLQEFHRAVAERSWDRPVGTATGQCLDLGPVGAAFAPVRRLLRGEPRLRTASGRLNRRSCPTDLLCHLCYPTERHALPV